MELFVQIPFLCDIKWCPRRDRRNPPLCLYSGRNMDDWRTSWWFNQEEGGKAILDKWRVSCAEVINWRQLTLTRTDGSAGKGSVCLICHTNACKTSHASPARQHRGATRCLSSGTKCDVGARGDGRDGGGACWDEWHRVTAFIDTSSSGWEGDLWGGLGVQFVWEVTHQPAQTSRALVTQT